MLKTENPKNGGKALRAFCELGRIPEKRRTHYVDVFEHGQLWIVGRGPVAGAIWSVVDAEGPDTHNGFGFEQVSEPEDD